jgi:uncharacterized membrane protein
MSERSLEERIESLREHGSSDEEIVKLLIAAGYHESDIRTALKAEESEEKAGEVISLPAPAGEAVKSLAISAPQKKFLPGFIALFSNALALYKKNALTLAEVYLLPVIALALTTIFFGAAHSTWPVLRFVWGTLAGLGYVVSFFLAAMAVLAVATIFNSDGMSSEEAYWRSLKKIGPYYWLLLLEFLITLGGMVMGVLPAIIFGVWFSMAIFIFVDQEQRGINALLRSKEYVTGYWWGVFGRTLLMAFIVLIIEAIIGGAAGVFGQSVNYMVSLALQLITVPFSIAFSYTIYKALKEMKPELVGEPVKGNRSFFLFSAWLGVASPIIVLSLAAIIAVHYGRLPL